MQSIESMIEVLQAYIDGKSIQVKGLGIENWETISSLSWRFDVFEYRVSPVPREFWINEYGSSKRRIHNSQESADEAADTSRTGCLHLREVLDE